jgi:hypothetical protein
MVVPERKVAPKSCRAFLNVTDGKKHIQRTLGAFGVSQSCYPVVAGIELKVLEFVRFIDVKCGLITHVFEIDCIILTVFDGGITVCSLASRLSYALCNFQHGTGNFFALVFEYLQIFLHAVEFGL